jgi:hypothetical protein
MFQQFIRPEGSVKQEFADFTPSPGDFRMNRFPDEPP